MIQHSNSDLTFEWNDKEYKATFGINNPVTVHFEKFNDVWDIDQLLLKIFYVGIKQGQDEVKERVKKVLT